MFAAIAYLLHCADARPAPLETMRMNILQVRDADGQLIREQLVDPAEPVSLTWTPGQTIMLGAPPGWQMNGHRFDCRCETCRPDIARLP